MSTTVQTLHTPSPLQHFVLAVVTALRNTAAAWHRSRRQRTAPRERGVQDGRMLQESGVRWREQQ